MVCSIPASGTSEMAMTQIQAPAAGAPLQKTRPSNPFAGRPLAVVGLGIILVATVVAIFAPLLAPHDPYLVDTANLLHSPSGTNLMGTDQYGRDILSRIIWGARVSLGIGVSSVVIGTTAGALIGLVGGYFGGPIDYALQRIVDILMAFPLLVLALTMVAALGSGTGNIVIAIAVVIAPGTSRVIRATTLSVRERPYVEAARNLGFSQWRIIFGHVLPNCLAPFIIVATNSLGGAILTEAALSFLGLGTPPPQPSWGSMLAGEAQAFVTQAPWIAIFPGLAITLVVFGFNFLGDGIRDALDPRRQK
jgi:peptide/nickel transport system permease protein